MFRHRKFPAITDSFKIQNSVVETSKTFKDFKQSESGHETTLSLTASYLGQQVWNACSKEVEGSDASCTQSWDTSGYIGTSETFQGRAWLGKEQPEQL